jgi:hypothetical protein
LNSAPNERQTPSTHPFFWTPKTKYIIITSQPLPLIPLSRPTSSRYISERQDEISTQPHHHTTSTVATNPKEAAATSTIATKQHSQKRKHDNSLTMAQQRAEM